MKKITSILVSAALIATTPLLFTSCFDAAEVISNEEVMVTTTFSDFGFTLTPDEVGQTRAGESMPTNINRIALKVFDESGNEFKTESHKKGFSDNFGTISFSLPEGNYTFVAVCHEASETAGVANIISATSAKLPEKVIYDTYTCVKQVNISGLISGNVAVQMDMGKRINSTFRFKTLDAVPDDVNYVELVINKDATAGIDKLVNPEINPTTGLAVYDLKFTVKVDTSTGQAIDNTTSILLNADSKKVTVAVNPKNSDNLIISAYARTFEEVEFRRAHTTTAHGYYFSQGTSSSFTFDTSTGSLDYEY